MPLGVIVPGGFLYQCPCCFRWFYFYHVACRRFKNRHPFRLIPFRCFLTMHKGPPRFFSVVAFLVIYTEAQHRIRSQTVFYIFITSLKKFICIDAPIIGFRHITCIQGLRLLDDLKFRPFNNHFFDKLFHTVASLNNLMKYYYETKRSQLLYSNWLLSTLYWWSG